MVHFALEKLHEVWNVWEDIFNVRVNVLFPQTPTYKNNSISVYIKLTKFIKKIFFVKGTLSNNSCISKLPNTVKNAATLRRVNTVCNFCLYFLYS